MFHQGKKLLLKFPPFQKDEWEKPNLLLVTGLGEGKELAFTYSWCSTGVICILTRLVLRTTKNAETEAKRLLSKRLRDSQLGESGFESRTSWFQSHIVSSTSHILFYLLLSNAPLLCAELRDSTAHEPHVAGGGRCVCQHLSSCMSGPCLFHLNSL